MLMRVRPDLVKLDRALVESLAEDGAAQTLVESLVRLSRSFHAEVCADGVEDVEDLHALARLEVRYAQGRAVGPAGRRLDAPASRRRGHRPARQGGGRLPASACVYRAAGDSDEAFSLIVSISESNDAANDFTPSSTS